jgi:predicted PurR-regulated permease PerM
VTDVTIIFLASFGVFLLVFIAISSLAIRLASQLSDTRRRLKTSQQAHALDVQALSKKVYEQAQALTEMKRSTHD